MAQELTFTVEQYKRGTTLMFRFSGTETRGEFICGMSYTVSTRPAAKREIARLIELGYTQSK